MKIRYCKKYENYVSEHHCDFFNDGRRCEYYSSTSWNSIKDLLQDEGRPKWEVKAGIKPFQCNLVDRNYLNALNLKHRAKGRSTGIKF